MRVNAMFIAGLLCVAANGAASDDFDFLDYLGSMVEHEDEWLDPLAMEIDNEEAADAEDQTPLTEDQGLVEEVEDDENA
ncbi:MAG: hypothetical protein AB8F65_12500 [Woeseiaceae bacterium]